MDTMFFLVNMLTKDNIYQDFNMKQILKYLFNLQRILDKWTQKN